MLDSGTSMATPHIGLAVLLEAWSKVIPLQLDSAI